MSTWKAWHCSTVICHLKPAHNEKVREVISLSKLGFRTLMRILCKYLTSAELRNRLHGRLCGIITVNISFPASRHCACFICRDDLLRSHSGMLERLFRSREAGCIWMRKQCDRGSRDTGLKLPASYFSFKRFQKWEEETHSHPMLHEKHTFGLYAFLCQWNGDSQSDLYAVHCQIFRQLSNLFLCCASSGAKIWSEVFIHSLWAWMSCYGLVIVDSNIGLKKSQTVVLTWEEADLRCSGTMWEPPRHPQNRQNIHRTDKTSTKQHFSHYRGLWGCRPRKKPLLQNQFQAQ